MNDCNGNNGQPDRSELQLNATGQAQAAKVVLSAFGIHTGGGAVLLRALLADCAKSFKVISLDKRFKDFDDSILKARSCQHITVRKSFLARIVGVIRLSSMTKSGDIMLCFNSLPPLLRCRGRVVTFVHAPHFVNRHVGIGYGFVSTIRIFIERVWFRIGAKNSDEFWVQTRSMSDALRLQYPDAKVKIVPIVDNELASRMRKESTEDGSAAIDHTDYLFFYPADGVGHKNHANLLKAWELLAKEKKYPKLVLTLTEDEWNKITRKIGRDVRSISKISNIGRISRSEVLEMIRQSSALIFPSLAETFGLPMLEARMENKQILASERDFVRDVCTPSQTFDPNSPRSIAMAVGRFMDNGYSVSSDEYYSAKEFVSYLLRTNMELRVRNAA